MIDRYEAAEITRIWSEKNKYRKWLDVELAITETWAEMGEVPAASLENIRKNAAVDPERIRAIEKKVKHDVIAFLTSLEEAIGRDSAYVHKGITSYDVVDTALSLLIQESLDVAVAKSGELAKILLEKAFAYKDLPAIGRTHGIHAEPIAFGCKFLIWHEEMERDRQRLLRAKEITAVGKISGSVGTYSHFPASGEEKALHKLGLRACRVSSQIIQRDRHAEVIWALALLGTSLEKIAVEIRHLQKTETLEVEEPFSRGQKGSSSMPHKRNPVRCERISGLARILRGHAAVALENNILWHERDISHSSAERVIFPDSFHLAVFMLDDMIDILKNLAVYPENIRRNLDLTHEIYFSQKVLTLLVDKGVARQRAYDLVQDQAMKSWQEKRSFRELVMAATAIRAVCSPQELEKAFSLTELLAGIGGIFERFAKGK
ncbi:MAG: adenylosuccinate lyase [Candidatus Aminicenantes bacterium]|nr:adenylosuccinate lyase [Acidobacteriota bacterium]MCG2811575.1 adenylosuccinate lyase [Candidatus Aminicenantes bacterium]